MTTFVVQNKDIRKAVREAVLKIGITFKKKDPLVLIKPNVNTSTPYPGSTNPLVVKEVVKLCREAGAKRIIVGDRSYNPFFLQGYKNSLKNMEENGIKKAAEEEGAKVFGFEESTDWIRVNPQKASFWPNGFRIPAILKEADYIISLPVLKTHYLADFSLSLKNSVGIVHTGDRIKLHLSNRYEKIAEINLCYKPDLIVVDGSKAFISGGPSEGKIVDPGLIIVGNKRVETDIKCYEILRSLGADLPPDPQKHPIIKHALKIGLE